MKEDHFKFIKVRPKIILFCDFMGTLKQDNT